MIRSCSPGSVLRVERESLLTVVSRDATKAEEGIPDFWSFKKNDGFHSVEEWATLAMLGEEDADNLAGADKGKPSGVGHPHPGLVRCSDRGIKYKSEKGAHGHYIVPETHAGWHYSVKKDFIRSMMNLEWREHYCCFDTHNVHSAIYRDEDREQQACALAKLGQKHAQVL
jgi:hypothetical protein